MNLKTERLNVANLRLDLENYRAPKQPDEKHALNAMIGAKPDWFWALTESLLDDGYYPTENIIVVRSEEAVDTFIVKEGNRRVGSLKFIFGLLNGVEHEIPRSIQDKVKNLGDDWKATNLEIPCTIFDSTELDSVDRLITRIHGKGDKTGRDHWSAVARARHNRDMQGAKEHGLDLLEAWLLHGKNISLSQQERFGADYNLSVLDEALNRIAKRLDYTGPAELVSSYPNIPQRGTLEDILLDIAHGELKFPIMRDTRKDIFSSKYNLPLAKTHPTSPVAAAGASTAGNNSPASTGIATSPAISPTNVGTQAPTPASNASASSSPASLLGGATSPPASSQQGSPKKPKKAVAANDPKSIRRLLRGWQPVGNDRGKIVLLKDELLKIDLKECPHAFCFVLRTLFELSAKAYCSGQSSHGGPSYLNAQGNEKKLKDILTEVTNHIIDSSAAQVKQAKSKELHGALTQLHTSGSILSVMSMNALVHNPLFVVDDHHICIVFNNIFPLLREMNQ